ncbi:uncharacterized protein [Apostichopus japonicus]|uniref:uncharacterized protein isoform X2 n=1 Tax=Stichopus japonicus TaxID=307972 RepID=UPI003AB75125
MQYMTRRKSGTKLRTIKCKAKMLILRKLIIPWMIPYFILSGLQQSMADKQNTVQRQTKLAKVGFPTEITCSFNFPDRDYYIIWFKNGNHLFQHEPAISLDFRIDGRVYTINEQEETALLGIQKVRVGDAGEYYCTAVHTFVGRPMFQYWKINVQDGPIIASTRYVMENETFSAQCCVTFTYSTEPVKYLWSLGIPLATTFTDNFDGNVTCSNVSFTAVRGFHNKLLVCTIQNELNSSTNKRINVMDKQNTVQRQTKLAKVGFSTVITCSIDFLDRNYFVIWYKNGKYLFEHEPRMSLNLSRDGRIYTRNEQEDIALLRIQNVSVRDAGEYHCKAVHISVGKPMFQYWKINVQVPPTMKLQINGHDTNATVFLANGTHVNITCYAEDSTTKAYISWNCNEKTCPSEGSLSNDMHEKLNNATREFFTADSTINYTAMRNEDVICTAGIYGDRNWTKSVKISVFVPPTMNFQINGHETNATVFLANGTHVNFTCYAEDSMPKANISWKCGRKTCEGSPLNDLHKRLNSASLELFTTSSTINYMAMRNEDVICTAGMYGKRNWTKNVKISVFDLNPDRSRNNKLVHLVIILTGGVVLTGCLLIMRNKLCSHRTTLPYVNRETTLDNRYTHVAMSSRELSTIQSNRAEPFNIGQSKQEQGNRNRKNERKCLSADDVKLSFQLSGEGTITYWEGTLSSGDSSSSFTKVIAKSVSENACMKEILNFRALASTVIRLQTHENIVEVLGVSLEDVPYFIYQEYIETGTLKDVLMSGGSYKVAPSNYKKNVQLTTFAADVCEGMYFLAKQNYRHPGLSARKALLSSTGRCKLYDFWPADLATDVMNQILTKKIPPIAWLAPETVFIGNYLEKSDVWSFGVVLWEIFSLGKTPFGGLTCTEIENKLRRNETLEQPMACAGGIFGAMLSMWNPTIDERPSFESLQLTLRGYLNDMRQSCNYDADDEEPSYFTLNKYQIDDDYTEHMP